MATRSLATSRNERPPTSAFSPLRAAWPRRAIRSSFVQALQRSQAALSAAQVPFHTHRVLARDRARSIVETAQQLGCHHLVMGTARKNSLTRMVEDSVTDRVLELTTLPVEVIAGDAVSKLERFGIPAGIALGVGLLVLATD